MSAEILRALQLLCPVGIVEIRIFGALPHKRAILAGYYDRDHFAEAARDIARYPKAKAVYVTLNEIAPALLARCANRLENSDVATADQNVTHRRWLLVDCDPKRPSGVSSTETEHQAGLNRCRQIARHLREHGWPDPVFGDSGNGGHLLYPVALPNVPESAVLLKNVLLALAARFDDDAVQVDTGVYNAGRISKLYGTWARKGDDTPERPHRQAQLLHIPDWATPDSPDARPDVPAAILAACAQEYRSCVPAKKPRTANHAPLSPFDMDDFLRRTGLARVVHDPLPLDDNGTKWQLDCPFNPSHKAPDAILTLSGTGAPGFHCSHSSCQHNDFKALRDKLEPGWKSRPVGGKNTAFAETPRRLRRAFAPETDDELFSPETLDELPEDEARGPSVSTRLVELVREHAHLWKTPEGATYATLQTGPVCQTWPIESSGFKRLIRRLYYEETGRAPSASALSDGCGVLDAIADAHGAIQVAHNRKAFDAHAKTRFGGDGPILYLDLCNDKWQFVRVTPDGWDVLPQTPDAPVRFRRARGMLSLPAPVPGGSVSELRRFVNIGPPNPDGPGDFALLVAWLLAALGPHRPYPVLNLAGEQGSAKSSTARTLRALVDPAKPALRPEPRDEQDIAIACTNAFTVAYDNLSFLPPWLSDALCRVSTGGGFGTRALWTNDEEALFDFMCPVLLTGIGESASRPDLLERSLLLTLPSIRDDARQDEDELGTAFEEARPRLLGALLDAVAHGLRHLPETRLTRKPRMADFARWVVACETGGELGWPEGTFLDLYEANREAAVQVGLEATALAPLLLKLLAEITGDGLLQQAGIFEGTAAELLQAVSDRASDRDKKRLPTNARALSVALRRIEPALRQTGITVTHERVGKDRTRLIRIGRQPEETESAPPATREAFDFSPERRTQTADANPLLADANAAAKPRGTRGADANRSADAKKPLSNTGWEEMKKRPGTGHVYEEETQNKRVGDFASAASAPRENAEPFSWDDEPEAF